MEILRLSWLGHPLVELEGQAVKLETRKATALLSYLSLAPGKAQRELLASMFWPEGSQQKALANFRRTLSSLNASLPGWIEADRESVALKPNGTLWVDVEIFHQYLSQLQQHNHIEKEVCDSCLAMLEKTVRLYRGEFLEGLNLGDAPDFDEWQFFQRDSLRQELAGVLQRLSTGHAERCQWDQAIACARRWVALDRLHEPARQALIDLYARAGQRTAALRQYEEFTRLLKEELGQEPEQETLQLYEQVRGQEGAKRAKEPTRMLFSYPLLKTKLYIPTVPLSRVVRSALLERLDEAGKKALTIISAPAGFGKTTLLAEWIAQTDLPVAWLSLDNGDNDSYRFLSYLIAALESIEEDAGREAKELVQSPQPLPSHIILAALINDLAKIGGQYVLVLDDYQFISEHAVHETMAYLLDHIPANMHIVLATRADPPLSLGRLRAYDQMLELRTQDLRFDFHEAGVFLNDVMKLRLPVEEIDALEKRTEGWVVGLQMAALSLKGHENAREFIRAFSGTHRYVLDYLMEEVLKRQSTHIQTFLLATSILEKLSGPLCDALMTREWRQSGESGQTVLEYLERNNLFLLSMDDERKWFRYHHLFADLLRSRLKQSDPQLEVACHRQAAKWFAENDYRVEAIDHSLSARDFTAAADFIETFAHSLIARNEVMTISRWIKSLPHEVLQDRPRLIIYHALALARLGDTDKLEAMLQKAESMLYVTSPSSGLDELSNYLKQLRTYMANTQSDADSAIKIVVGTKEQPAQEEAYLTDVNYLVGFELAYAYYSKGDIDIVETILQSVAKKAEIAEDIYNTMVARMELANVQLLRGALTQAEKIYEHTQEWLTQKVENPAAFEGILKVCRANLLLERNELEIAHRMVQEGINQALLGSLTNTVTHGYTILANIYKAQGAFHLAHEALEKAIDQLQNRSTYPRSVKNVKTCQVDLWLTEGNLIAAQEWVLEEFKETGGPMPFYRESEHITLARVLLASKQFEQASNLLGKLAEAAEAGRREGRLIKIHVLQALALNSLGQEAQALQILKKTLVQARREGYVRVFLDEGAQLRDLLQRGKQQGRWQETALCSYVDKLLDAFRGSSS